MRLLAFAFTIVFVWTEPQAFSKIESGPNYTTAVHAFVKATLRLGLRAPFVARNYNY